MKAGGGRALRESEGYEPVLRAPFKQGGRKKRNGKTLCYGGHRARGGGFRRQATPRARPLDASAVNLEPRREFLRLTGRVPSRQTWDEASHAACGRCGVRASGDPREARGRGDPPAAPRSPGSTRFVVPAARTTKTLAALPAPVPCSRLGPFCEIPAIPPMTPLPAQANRGRFLTARGAAPPACVGNVAFAWEGRGASSG